MLCQYQNKPVVADLCICSACSTSEVPCKGHTCIGARLQLICSTSQFLYSAKLKVKLFLLLSSVSAESLPCKSTSTGQIYMTLEA